MIDPNLQKKNLPVRLQMKWHFPSFIWFAVKHNESKCLIVFNLAQFSSFKTAILIAIPTCSTSEKIIIQNQKIFLLLKIENSLGILYIIIDNNSNTNFNKNVFRSCMENKIIVVPTRKKYKKSRGVLSSRATPPPTTPQQFKHWTLY